MTATDTPIANEQRRIVAAWTRAFARWEQGEGASPSADDLIAEAQAVTVAFPADADLLYDILCEGHTLKVALHRYLVALDGMSV